jgi:hypothetical protein
METEHRWFHHRNDARAEAAPSAHTFLAKNNIYWFHKQPATLGPSPTDFFFCFKSILNIVESNQKKCKKNTRTRTQLSSRSYMEHAKRKKKEELSHFSLGSHHRYVRAP